MAKVGQNAADERKKMDDPCEKLYDQYIAAMAELNEATRAAQGFGMKGPLEDGEEAPELKDDGKSAFRRLTKANEMYAEKYKAWMDCFMGTNSG